MTAWPFVEDSVAYASDLVKQEMRFTCMCIIYVCIYIYLYTYTHTNIYIHTHTHTHTCIHTYIHAYSGLVAEHKKLVALGQVYGKMDRSGKLIYIDELEAVEERWAVFLKRFELMGELNPLFVQQTRDYLFRLQINSDNDFLDLLKRARNLMRADAERT